MSSYWGLTQQRGPWKSTPLDLYNAKSSLEPYGTREQSNDKLTTMTPFVTSDHTDENVADMDPSYLPSIVQSNSSLHSPMAIQLKAGKSTKRNRMEDKLKRGGRKDTALIGNDDAPFLLQPVPIPGQLPMERPRGYLTPAEMTSTPLGVVTPKASFYIPNAPPPPSPKRGMNIDTLRVKFSGARFQKRRKNSGVPLTRVETKGPRALPSPSDMASPTYNVAPAPGGYFPQKPYYYPEGQAAPVAGVKRAYDPKNEQDFASRFVKGKRVPVNSKPSTVAKKQKTRGRKPAMSPGSMQLD